MSESLEIPGSFYAFHSGAFLGVGGLEAHADVFRTLFVLQQFLSQLKARKCTCISKCLPQKYQMFHFSLSPKHRLSVFNGQGEGVPFTAVDGLLC